MERTNQLDQSTNMDVLKFVLNNSFFTYGGKRFHQVFGCAMGSPVSAVIAVLVMEHVEVTAFSTYASLPRWWRRYVDDSNTCLKSNEVEKFHLNLNFVNPRIQFTFERASKTNGRPTIPFWTRKSLSHPAEVVTSRYTAN